MAERGIAVSYETISQFYNAIRHGLMAACETLGESKVLCGDPAWQITDAFS